MINNSLGKFFGVLGNFGESSCSNTLESEFRLLNTKNEKTNSAGINNSLGQFVVMFSDATESKCGSLFDRGVKLFEAVN